MASDLCGQACFTERDHARPSLWGGSREQDRDRRVWHDVMTPGMIRQLPAGHALIIRGGCAPVIARLAAAWKDPAWKRARRTGTATLALTPATTPAGRSGRAHLTVVPDPADEAAPGARSASPAYPWS